MTSTQSRPGGLEIRSIDYVPLSERHGKVWHLGPLWFMSNAQIATLAVGLISITEGASLFWSVLAIVVGVLIGTLFMAFHSAQGPQLGLPQMIQSRPQFGYIGALLVWLFAYVQYAGFNVFNTILGGEAMSTTAHGPVKLWVVILTVVALVIALVGYDLIHKAEQWLTYLMIVIFGIFTITLFFIHYPVGTFDVGTFKASPFLGQFGVVAGYQISWAIYVSDYSRYLPPDVTVRKTFYWTYWGSAIGGGWMMIVGAVLAAWAGKNFDGTGIAELNQVGDHVFTGFGAVVLILATLGLGRNVRRGHVQGERVPWPVRRGGRVPDPLGVLRLGLLPVHAAGHAGPQDVLLDLLGIGDRRCLDDDHRRGPGRLGRVELQRYWHRRT